MNSTSTDVLISKDSVAEIKQLIARSPQKVEVLGYWNGKEYEPIDLD
jgi:hypothetical protein